MCRISKIIEKYKELYNLPELNHEENEEVLGEEVEIKLKLDEEEAKNILGILNNSAIGVEEIIERDIYFTSGNRDFIASKECLRIRETNGECELTYKGPSTQEMLDKRQFWKTEINIDVNSTPERINLLLEALGFTKVADFTKTRKKFLYGASAITLDNIEKLGYFLEIEEIINDPANRENALKKNAALIKKFGLSEEHIVNEPYRDLILKAVNIN